MAEQTLSTSVSNNLGFKEARINKELFESAGGSDNEPMKITFGSDHIIVNVKGDSSVEKGKLDIDEYTGKYLGISEPTEAKVEPLKFKNAESVTFINSVKIDEGEGNEDSLSRGLQNKFNGKYITLRDKITVLTDENKNKIPLEIKKFEPKDVECVRIVAETDISVELETSSDNIGGVLPESKDVQTTYSDIQAHEDKRNEIEDLVNSVLSGSEIFTRSKNSGLLIYGPNGSGKSKLSKAVANESNAAIRILSDETLSRSESAVVESIEKAFNEVKNRERSILLVERIEEIYSSKKSRQEFISQINSLNEGDNLFIFAECRDLEDIDSEFLNESGLNNSIRIGFPSRESRERVLTAEMNDITHFLNEDDFFEISQSTAGFSISDLLKLIQSSKYAMYRRIRQTYPLYKSVSDVLVDENEGIKKEDFTNGLESVRPTLSRDRSINEVYTPKKETRGVHVNQKDIATVRQYMLENSKENSSLRNRKTYLLYGPNKDDVFEIILSVSADLGWPIVTINTRDMVSSRGFGRILSKIEDISPAIMLIDDIEFLFEKVGRNRIRETLNKGLDNSDIHIMSSYHKVQKEKNNILSRTPYESIGNKIYIGFPDESEAERILGWAISQKGWTQIDASSLLTDVLGLSGSEMIAAVNKAEVYLGASSESMSVELLRDTFESFKQQDETKLRESVEERHFYDLDIIDSINSRDDNPSNVKEFNQGEIDDGFVWEK